MLTGFGGRRMAVSLDASSSWNPCYVLQPEGQEGKERHGSSSHFQLLVAKDKQIDDGESKASFLLSPACINEKGCEVPLYEFRFC